MALNEGGGGEWGKDMRGQRHSREGDFLGNLGEESNIWRLGTVCVCWFDIFWFGVWRIVTGVHHVTGSFGLGGQESSRNPRARESDRLCS